MGYFNEKIEKYLNVLVKNLNANENVLELELKIKGYKKIEERKFKDEDKKGIEEYKYFQRVKKYLTEIYGETNPERTEDFIKNSKGGNERYTLVNTPLKSYMKKIIKTRIWNDKDFKYDTTGTLSSEIDQDVDSLDFYDVQRIKTRYSWTDTRKNLKFDITDVKQTSKGETKDNYEVEIEFIHPLLQQRVIPLSRENIEELRNNLKILFQQMIVIKNVINDSDILYSTQLREELANFINIKLDAKKYLNFKRGEFIKDGEMVENIATKARNIKFKDMVYGGLLSKLNTENKTTRNAKMVEYSVTVKVDGLRKFLVVHSTGLWLVYGKEFCCICPLPELWKEYIDSIFDGEDIDDKSMRKAYLDFKHYYLPFDTLLFKGKDVSNQTLQQRRSYIKNIRNLGTVSFNNKNSLVVEEKPFIFFSEEPESFYKAVDDMLSYKPSYETDGLIFTPNKTEYNTRPYLLRDEDRVLTKNPDICKWKPFEQLTIDLSYCVVPEGRFLCYSKRDELIRFEGSDLHSFDPETQVDWMHKLFNEANNGTIMEFEPIIKDKTYILRPKKIRYDKQYANGKKVAVDVWNDIHDPITLDTIKGKTFRLLRKYHNRVKRSIFGNVQENAHLIDIGSGNGGDIEKMNKFSRVLCIEPSQKNLTELKNRLSTSFMRDRIETLNCGGEDTGKILNAVKTTFGDEFGTKPLYISMMLSLSFFWRDIEIFNSLIDTINSIRKMYYKNGGKSPIKFLFLTIEGNRALELLKKYNYNIRKPAYEMSYNETFNEVYINIENSIVEKQTEYLVNLEQFMEVLYAQVDYFKEANDKELLSKDEMEFTNMYVYGSYILKEIEYEEKYVSQIEQINDTKVSYKPPESTSTLFDCLFKSLKPEEKYEFVDVLYFRKEISESIVKPNPFDELNRSFFDSADNGILSKISKTPYEAQEWILSDTELPPEYITWIPDVIGYNLNINDNLYPVSFDKNVETINLKYDGHTYELI